MGSGKRLLNAADEAPPGASDPADAELVDGLQRRRPRHPIRILIVVAALLAGSLSAFLTLRSSGGGGRAPDGYRLQVAERAEPQPVNQPVLWLQLGDSPSAEELARAATVARVVVLNAWELDALRTLKAANPRVTVLVYKDLASTRSYPGAVTDGRDAALLPTGVGYAQATAAHPDWFAEDRGSRIEWDGYPGHWQMAVWNEAYQQAWTDAVTSEVRRNGWDGVFADNALATLRYYDSDVSPVLDKRLADGVVTMVDRAGGALAADGKLLVPNVSDGRLHPGRFARLARYGGAMEEQFLHVAPEPASGLLGDPPGPATDGVDGSASSASDWDRQAVEVGGPGTILVHTQAAAGDRRSFLYGYAGFLIAGGGYGAFFASLPNEYDRLSVQPEQLWPTPITSFPVRSERSLRWRWFPTVLAVANPSNATLRITLPFTMIDGAGKPVGTVTLGPHSGAVLQRDPVATGDSPEPRLEVRQAP